MAGVLLDTHTLYWLVSGVETLSENALLAIGESQLARNLYLSPITAWELSLALKKPNNAPQLGDLTVSKWFAQARRATEARMVSINLRIALEAASVVDDTGHRDPGDCYLIATARVRNLTLISRDGAIRKIARAGYLDFMEC